MTILSKHIFKGFITRAAGILIGILIVYLCVEFLQKADKLIKHHATIYQIGRYFLYSIPGMISMALPMATLIAALLLLGDLSRHNEIIAMRAGGISLAKIITPLFVGGILVSSIGFINNEFVVPFYSSRAQYVRKVEIEKSRQRVMFQHSQLWLRGPDNSIVNIGLVSPNRNEMLGLNIFKLNPDYSVREQIKAGRLVWENGAWRLKNSLTFTQVDDVVRSSQSDNEVFNIVDDPDDLGMIVKDSEEMNFPEMWSYVNRLKLSGYKAAKPEVELHSKLSLPLASVLMIMISIPFGIRTARSGGTSMGIALAIGIAFIYWMLASVGASLGNSGAIPPVLSAWFANIFFAVMSSIAIFRMQRSI
jgi:lipopolysaccharide export system permease protein